MAEGSGEPIRLLPKMRPFHAERRRHKVARGGRGGGKSWCIARLLLLMGAERKLRILCAREIQKSIKDSVHKLLADQIEAMGLASFYEVQATTIKGANGTEFLFTGLQDHTSASIKSYEGCDLCWIEEAATVSAHSANILIPTIRKSGSELWWSYNPDQDDDFVHADIAKRADALVIDVNHTDNPWFPVELEQERLALRAINEDLYQHVWEGKCRTKAGILFKRHWFKYYDELPASLSRGYMAGDYAGGPDPDNPEREPDFTEFGCAKRSSNRSLYFVDWWYEQCDPAVWMDAGIAMADRNKALIWYEEKGPILRTISATLNDAMARAGRFTYRHALPSVGNKVDRALGFAALAQAGLVYFPRNEPWTERVVNQLCAFTGQEGKKDDAVDVCSLLARGLDAMLEPPKDADAKSDPMVDTKAPKPFTKSWLEEDPGAMSDRERSEYYR